MDKYPFGLIVRRVGGDKPPLQQYNHESIVEAQQSMTNLSRDKHVVHIRMVVTLAEWRRELNEMPSPQHRKYSR